MYAWSLRDLAVVMVQMRIARDRAAHIQRLSALFKRLSTLTEVCQAILPQVEPESGGCRCNVAFATAIVVLLAQHRRAQRNTGHASPFMQQSQVAHPGIRPFSRQCGCLHLSDADHMRCICCLWYCRCGSCWERRDHKLVALLLSFMMA